MIMLFRLTNISDQDVVKFNKLALLNLNELILIGLANCSEMDVNKTRTYYYIDIKDDDHYNTAKKLKNFTEWRWQK